ncbi:MAG: GNAT family N-acetyltransferase, partial [Kineosporiaceae bacterium]
GADAAVRPAGPADAAAVGAIHARAWRSSYAVLLPEDVRAGLEPDALAAAWRSAVSSPPSPRHRLLVATATDVVTGFAALAPAEDPDTTPADAEVLALEVDPAHRGAGHGSRLLNAVADTARELGFQRLLAWVPEPDGDRTAFLTGAGAVADGARRVRGAVAGAVAGADTGDDPSPAPEGWTEIRLVAELAEAAP